MLRHVKATKTVRSVGFDWPIHEGSHWIATGIIDRVENLYAWKIKSIDLGLNLIEGLENAN